MLRAKWIRNAPDGNGTLFRGDIYQVPMNGLLGGTTGQRIWETNLVAQYSPGTRLITEDGRVFRYAKATNIISARKFGLKFWRRLTDGINAVAAGASAVGDTTVTLTGTATKNEYMGGYLIIWSTARQFRAILSNTATSGTTFVVTLAEPLTEVVTSGATTCKALQNPYASVRLCAGPSGGQAGDDFSSVAGVPYTTTAANNTYLWLQTWGPMWLNWRGSSLVTPAGGERKLVFDVEGSVCIEDDVAHGPGADTDEHQIAGFIIDRTLANVAYAPLVMLTINP